jgi:cyclopropane-fatty-acyl-phospholipid synthase
VKSQAYFLMILNRVVQDGLIRFRIGNEQIVVGRKSDAEAGHFDVTIRVNKPQFFRRVLRAGNLGMGEAFMERDFEIEEGTLQDFLTILLRNRLDKKIRARPLIALRISLLRLGDTLRGKAKNVRYHYDIGDDLFESFLDSTLTYSCGYVEDPNDDIEELQFNKNERICKKLRLVNGESLLDIGCGYGGLLIHAAKHYGIHGTGITISENHYHRGNEKIAQYGLSDRLRIELCDFTQISGQFDKIVSVGMMEHIPRRQYSLYFRNIARTLTPQGMGLVHTVGANAARNLHDPFIQKYIFPASCRPRLSEIARQLEIHGLAILDVENVVRHYAYTARRWLNRFQQKKAALDQSKYDDTFLRMWEYFLCCCIAAATASDSAVYQVLFFKDYAAELPLHRV